MMDRKKIFVAVQVLAVLVVTVVAGTVILCFPNPPSFMRSWLNRHRVVLEESSAGKTKLDQRFLDWFNRDPERHVPNEPRIIVSPADGVLERIIRKQGSVHLVIEMRYTDVHVQRVPISGRVVSIQGGGKELEKGFNVMDYELKKMMPFQKITTFETEIGTVRVRQITSFFAKRIKVFLKTNQTYEIGTRLGNVLAGSTVVLELPARVEIVVKQGDEMLAGETIVARY